MFLIRSGIPSLDMMFHPTNWTAGDEECPIDEYGISLDALDQTTSICVAGPDGTGKSVLAMHFASRYLSDCHQVCQTHQLSEPHAFYISTDLSLSKAQTMWNNFNLQAPNMRRIPFRYPQLRDETKLPVWLGAGLYDRTYTPQLTPYEPDQLEKLADYLHATLYETRPQPEVAFIDLASHTAGDDWGFTERLLAAIPKPQSAIPRDIVLIDAMEGMETLTGEVDAFGEKVTRRGRVAKLMRLASHKCHLVFIVEEPQEKARTAEQFVADVVLRLRAIEDSGYSRRTIEIEKARGQSHVRGRHPYVVRDGRGSTTGEQINFDDPRVEEGHRSQSYLDVYPSLHSASRAIMEIRAPAQEHVSHRRAGFGIEELDEMLAKRQTNSPDELGDDRGLPCGMVSALIGDANTQKSFLGHAFLGYGFYPLAAKLVSEPASDSVWSPEDCAGFTAGAERHYVNCLCTTDGPGNWHRPVDPKELSPDVCRWASRIHKEGFNLAGASVLITTRDENHRILVDRFFKQLETVTTDEVRHDAKKRERVEETWRDPAFRHAFAAYLQSRTICRRLEIHDTPSAVLFHVMKRAIEAAQQIVQYNYPDVCLGGALKPFAAERAQYGWRIRFVLDDFNSIMRTYGRIHDDPLFLPFLMLYLRREGLSSLIIETQSGTHGMPATTIGDDAQSDLRALSDNRLYTWHITGFFGDHRIAIAAIPPMVQRDIKSPVLVRELEWYDPSQESPTPRVNPRFELYTGLDTNQPALVPLRVHLYAESPAWESYIRSLDEIWRRVFEPANLGQEHRILVVAEKASNYDLMREVAVLLEDTNLPYSLVIQIDEFWHHRKAFRTQVEYWKRKNASPASSHRKETAQPIASAKWFDDLGYAQFAKAEADVDRIPFIWDFGFLACREDLWTEALGQGATNAEARKDVRRLWARLQGGEQCEWAEVLHAASYVARWESTRQSRPIPAFDLAMMAPETFSCLVLEIWFSEICQNRPNPSGAEKLYALMKRRSWKPADDALSLAELVAEYEMELYCTWLLLAQSLDLNGFEGQTEGFGFAFGRTANPDAILTRHWYKSAAATDPHEKKGSVLFSRLPGRFSTRGDWFLTTVRGSRSDRLADHALDQLSTCEANTDRLMRGLGLPTRKLSTQDEYLSSRLRGRVAGSNSSPSTLSYHDVRSLGVTPTSDNFHWLWRGNLKDYESAARIWERWLYRILRRWKRTREHFASDWIDGFLLYDTVKKDGLYEKASQHGDRGHIPEQVVSITDFPEQCRILRGELQQAAASTGARL
jgi:KaiC/GvpD/RAD55 family RecA-like ATPase